MTHLTSLQKFPAALGVQSLQTAAQGLAPSLPVSSVVFRSQLALGAAWLGY
jgi:hypothetical protein